MNYNIGPKEFSESVRKRIGRNIRSMREEEGLTPYQLTQITGLSWHTIQKWELGLNAPTVDRLLWFCRTTGWKLSEIIGGGKDG